MENKIDNEGETSDQGLICIWYTGIDFNTNNFVAVTTW